MNNCRIRGFILAAWSASFLFCAPFLTGCVEASKQPEVDAFTAAGPIDPVVDLSRFQSSDHLLDDYKVVPGDVLQLYMPEIMSTLKDSYAMPSGSSATVGTASLTTPYSLLSRVEESGNLVVPLLDRVQVADKTIYDIELQLKTAYTAKLLKKPPTIVVTVADFKTFPVRVIGAVRSPGIYKVRHDQLMVSSILATAGGIRQSESGNVGGAAGIRITKRNGEALEPLVLPIKDLDVPVVDAAVEPGDTVEAIRLIPKRISVMGLVNKPTTIDYPPTEHYTIGEALATAGGMDNTAYPEFVTVYRQDPTSGKVVYARFRIANAYPPPALDVPLKPGDVVAVEHTALTRFNVLMYQFVRVGVGVSPGF